MNSNENIVCGYATHGGGGISNQKMAFIGALLDSFETGKSLIIPKFTEMDQVKNIHTPYDFEYLFDIEAFNEFTKRWGIKIYSGNNYLYHNNYEDCFWKTFNVFNEGMFDGKHKERDSFVSDAIRSIVPKIINSSTFNIIKNFFGPLTGLAVSQFRIEKDWLKHSLYLRDTHRTDDDIYLDHNGICKKIKEEIFDIKNLYVVCDENSLIKDKMEIKKDAFNIHGICLTFKSDLISEFDFNSLTPLQLSIIDFEISLLAKVFIGNSQSTFSNMVTLNTFLRDGVHPKKHFIYNKKGPLLLRNDYGLKTWL